MIEITFINIIGTGIIANMIAHWFLPVQGVKDKLSEFLLYIRLQPLAIVLNCSKCAGLWLGLVFFFDPFAAALTSLLGYLINHLIDRVEEWYK